MNTNISIQRERRRKQRILKFHLRCELWNIARPRRRAMSGQVDPHLIKNLDFINIKLLPKDPTFKLCFQIPI